MSAADPRVEQVVDAYRHAVFAKDADAFAALYDDDVRIFDMWGRWIYEGADAWRGMAAGWFASLGDEHVRVEMSDVVVTAGADLAVVHALVTYAGHAADGTRLRATVNRLTWALRPAGDGTWRIAHEHTSAPLDPGTGTVLPAH